MRWITMFPLLCHSYSLSELRRVVDTYINLPRTLRRLPGVTVFVHIYQIGGEWSAGQIGFLRLTLPRAQEQRTTSGQPSLPSGSSRGTGHVECGTTRVPYPLHTNPWM